jgi:catechol 2,3-dioxygenase-like lactoylglutathione lyase family enzyme
MRMALAVAMALASPACAQTAAPEKATAAAGVAAPKQRIPTDVRRLTILVRNMENSLKLYQGVMGLNINYDQKLTVSGVALPAGQPGNPVRLVLLNGNDPFIGWIGLMEYRDPPLEAEDPYPKRLKAGGHVLILDVDDAVKRCEMAKAVPGVEFTSEARLQVYPGRNGGPDIKVMGCNFFDPDGTMIEMNQIVSQ